MKRNVKELDVDFIGGEKPSDQDFAVSVSGYEKIKKRKTGENQSLPNER